ncbi:MAG: hypothetical protein FWF33_07725, partial [Clostridiales bacterium]|nr:hypothetical protein [Clostridiales bacterium]
MSKTKKGLSNGHKTVLFVILVLAVVFVVPSATHASQTEVAQGFVTKTAEAAGLSQPQGGGAATPAVQPQGGGLTALAAGSDRLAAEQSLTAEQSIVSANGTYKAKMQSDGNFVVFNGGTPIFITNTAGKTGAYAKFQGDGNFVLYQSGAAIWNSGTAGKGGSGSCLVMQDDGNLVIYKSAPPSQALWNSKAASGAIPNQVPSKGIDRLIANQNLQAGQSLTSQNGFFTAKMQSDGNLVVYNDLGTAMFSTKTSGKTGAFARFGPDGNFVIYLGSTALWNSQTGSKGGAYIIMQNDGNLVLYPLVGKALWNSKAASGIPATDKGDMLLPGSMLISGEYMLSKDKTQQLIMQADGNLVLLTNGKVAANSRTAGNPGAYFVFQGDGNKVVYNASGKAIYVIGGPVAGAKYFGLGNDGVL